ncbi:MAG TPA: cbb3-type cytochrome c oxidase subunit I [Candidatus Competibacteraceae bacterium]|nr:cbb3-type cytochrome c oxidase subunit I [Candidatus Competibacteraceae bacterium]
MKQPALTEGLRRLPAADKLLLRILFGAALLALILGVLAGAGTAATRGGFVEPGPLSGYRMMTAHGVNIFFYWLYFAQAGLLLVLSAVYTVPGGHIAWRPLAWSGLATMIAGFVSSAYAVAAGLPLLYDAPPELAGTPSPAVAAFYLGYLLLAVGLFCIAASAVATVLKPRFDHRIASWPVVSFAAIGWAGLLMVSSIAALNAFLPAARWAFGLAPMPSEYSVGWHILFHNMHYLPLMATVIVWYVLVQTVVGVKFIFGSHLSKIAFSLYLIFVPPTSLYHMFLEPNLAEAVRVIGSLLSLFISVPTVTVFLVIVASLEVHARAHGAKGLFGWIGMLPWRNPAMAAMGMAVVNLALGGTFSFVLIQEKLAPLLSDTFFVPGYFHFLTVGTVTLTFLGALCYVLPELTGRALWRPGLIAALPYIITAGLLIFGTAGIIAGYSGVPRRVLDVSYNAAAPVLWTALMAGIGIGGLIMAAGLLTYLFALLWTMWPAPAGETARKALPAVDWGGVTPAATRAWVGPLSVLLLVGAMAVFTALAFEILQSLPLEAGGAAGGH